MRKREASAAYKQLAPPVRTGGAANRAHIELRHPSVNVGIAERTDGPDRISITINTSELKVAAGHYNGAVMEVTPQWLAGVIEQLEMELSIYRLKGNPDAVAGEHVKFNHLPNVLEAVNIKKE